MQPIPYRKERSRELGTFSISLAVKDINGNYVMTTFHFQGERKGRVIDLLDGHLMRLTPGGKVAEGWGFPDDQEAWDDFFAA